MQTAAVAALMAFCVTIVTAETAPASGGGSKVKLAPPIKVKSNAGPTSRPAMGVMPPASMPASRPANETAATVNGKVITEGQIYDTIQSATQGRKITPEQMNMFRQQVLDFMINDVLFEEQAKKENITVDTAEVAAKMEADWLDRAKKQGMTKEQLAERIKQGTKMEMKDFFAKRASEPLGRKPFLWAKVVEKQQADKIKVSDAEVKELYEKNADTEYRKVKASHILIGTRDLKTDAEKAEAKKKAEQVLAEVKQPNADFAALAKQHSSCPSGKQQGGDLGFFPRKNAMVEPFAAAAFALKKGEISGIVETEFGYHIIKVTDRMEPTFAEAAAGIRDTLQRQKIGEEIGKYSDEMRKTAKIAYPPGKEPASRPAMSMARPPTARPSARPATNTK
jgi:peptidyl-prolyl cis-trans isomerase C